MRVSGNKLQVRFPKGCKTSNNVLVLLKDLCTRNGRGVARFYVLARKRLLHFLKNGLLFCPFGLGGLKGFARCCQLRIEILRAFREGSHSGLVLEPLQLFFGLPQARAHLIALLADEIECVGGTMNLQMLREVARYKLFRTSVASSGSRFL